MTPISVLFAAMPTMLRDVLAHGFASQADITIVTDDGPHVSLADAVGRTRAGAVVTCTTDGALPDRLRSLMYRFPRLKVVVLTEDGRAAALYRLVLTSTRRSDISPEDVLAAIRYGDEAPGA